MKNAGSVSGSEVVDDSGTTLSMIESGTQPERSVVVVVVVVHVAVAVAVAV